MNKNYDWSQFQVYTYINKPLAEVFQRWATCEGLESFFVQTSKFSSVSGELRKNNQIASSADNYFWKFIHDFDLPGQVVNVMENSFITYTFGVMEVKIEVSTQEKQTLVKLTQYKIPHATEEEKATNHLNCRSCWVFFMTNLKAVMESGTDLREHDPDKSDCISVHFKPV